MTHHLNSEHTAQRKRNCEHFGQRNFHTTYFWWILEWIGDNLFNFAALLRIKVYLMNYSNMNRRSMKKLRIETSVNIYCTHSPIKSKIIWLKVDQKKWYTMWLQMRLTGTESHLTILRMPCALEMFCRPLRGSFGESICQCGLHDRSNLLHIWT